MMVCKLCTLAHLFDEKFSLIFKIYTLGSGQHKNSDLKNHNNSYNIYINKITIHSISIKLNNITTQNIDLNSLPKNKMFQNF